MGGAVACPRHGHPEAAVHVDHANLHTANRSRAIVASLGADTMTPVCYLSLTEESEYITTEEGMRETRSHPQRFHKTLRR